MRSLPKVDARLGIVAFIHEHNRDRKHTSIGMRGPVKLNCL